MLITTHAEQRWAERFAGQDMMSSFRRAAPHRPPDPKAGDRYLRDEVTGAVFVVRRKGHRRRRLLVTVYRG